MRLLFIAIPILVASSVTAAEKKSFADEFAEAIDAIAARRGITKEEVEQQVRILLTDSQCFPVKGGVAVIRDSMYVLARTKNGVIAQNETAAGGDRKQPEIFVFADKKFVGRISLPPGSEKDVVVTLFTPERIRFFDWKELSGGFYRRSTE